MERRQSLDPVSSSFFGTILLLVEKLEMRFGQHSYLILQTLIPVIFGSGVI